MRQQGISFCFSIVIVELWFFLSEGGGDFKIICYSLINSYRGRLGLWPNHPASRNKHLNPRRHPQHTMNLPCLSRDPPTSHGPGQNSKKPQRPPIPLDIPGQRRRQRWVRRKIAQYARHHERGDFANAQDPASHHLSCGLETQ